MKNPVLPLLLLTLVVSALVAAATAALVSPAPASAGSDGMLGAGELAALTRAVERIEERQEQFATRVDDMQLLAAPTAARAPVGEIDAAVARYFEERSGRGAGELDEVQAEALAEQDERSAAQRVESALQDLLAGDLSQEQSMALWAEISELGLTDELVAAFEARAEREPNDPDVRVDLGEAYLQKVFEAGSGPMAGVWAMKADGAFDAALELDENHWDARFNKAISLSFWPPALGMQGKAIAQFETLLSKQANGPKDPKFAQTYLFLGNMYQQTGQAAKALGTWQEGLSLYPDSAQLSDQVELSSDQ